MNLHTNLDLTKDRVLEEERHEIEVKIGYILRKDKENIQKKEGWEKKIIKWSGKLDIK